MKIFENGQEIEFASVYQFHSSDKEKQLQEIAKDKEDNIKVSVLGGTATNSSSSKKGRKGKIQIIKNETLSSIMANMILTLLYTIFVVFSILQMVIMTNFFNTFYIAFDLVNEFNSATSYGAVLQNTGFTLWRHYNGLARPLSTEILQETLDVQELQIHGI
jgi:hypothetical protein